jgi:hypothetical protein
MTAASVPHPPLISIFQDGMHDPEEHLVVGAITDWDFAVSREGVPFIRTYRQSAKYIKTNLLAELIASIVQVQMAIFFYDRARNHAILVKGTRSTNIKNWSLRDAHHFARIFGLYIYESNTSNP